MFNPISSEVTYVIHQDKIRELERQIELNRMVREGRAYHESFAAPLMARLAQAGQWMQEKVLRRAAAPQIRVDEPCPTVPC